MTDDDFSVFPQMPPMTDGQRRELNRALAGTLAAVALVVDLFIFGPPGVAVPLMAAWLIFASLNERLICDV